MKQMMRMMRMMSKASRMRIPMIQLVAMALPVATGAERDTDSVTLAAVTWLGLLTLSMVVPVLISLRPQALVNSPGA